MFCNILICVLTIIPITLSTNDAIIMTTTGPISGKLVHDLDVGYFSYQGIPYAEPPIGILRFKPPVPKRSWTEVRDATKEGPVCYQSEGYVTKDQMNEDCLYINVYVPENKAKEFLPVLAYVHSGEFKKLSGNADISFGPQLLMQRNIIVVTLNYRLGALGYLSVNSEEASGNAGLKDILLALKWINANVERFGGDRNRITLGGNSSGAAAAHYLILSKKSTGLFHQAVLISGSALGYRFLALHPKENAYNLGKKLGIQTNDTHELLLRLRKADPFDIVQAQEDIGKNDTRKGFRPFAPFVPCIEIDYAEAIITQNPKEIIKKGIPQNIPIIVGFNTDEGLKMLPIIEKDIKLIDNLNDNFELCIPSNIEYPYGSKESIELASSIREFYFNGGDIANSTKNNFINLITDTMFSYSIDSWINLHKKREKSKDLYYYLLGFDAELNWFKITNNVSRPGTAHADELGYIFVTQATKQKLSHLDSRSQKMLDTMTSIIGNFVKTGNPTPRGALGVEWLKSGQQRNHLFMSDCIENRLYAPRSEFIQFWYNVYNEYDRYVADRGKLENKVAP